MAHVAKVVQAEQVNNGEIVVHIQCCGDPATESRHTFAVTKMTKEQIATDVATHITNSQNQHAAVQDNLASLQSMIEAK